MTTTPKRAAIYARVSTLDQEPEQLAELRRYVNARGWTAAEFIDVRASHKTSRLSPG